MLRISRYATQEVTQGHTDPFKGPLEEGELNRSGGAVEYKPEQQPEAGDFFDRR